MQTVFFHQGKILRQGRLLHEQQYRRRNRNRVVVADDAQKNQRNQKQRTKLKFIGLRYSGQRFFCQLDHGFFDFAVR